MEQLKFELIALSRSIRQSFKSIDKNENKKIAGTTYLILSLFTIAFFGLVAINPTVGTISNLRRQFDDNKQIDEKLSAKIASLSRLGLLYDQIQPNLSVVYNAIPTSPQIPSFTRKVEKLITEHNLSVSQFNVSSVELHPVNKTSPTLYSASFSLLVEGSPENVKSFISDIISIDRLVTLDAVNSGRADTGGMAVTLSGKIYFDK